MYSQNQFKHFNLLPQSLETSEQKKVTENSFYLSKKAPLQRQVSTCKASKHVKYKPYNTLESKQVPKSTVKITLPLMEMWRERKKKHQREKVKPKNDRIKKKWKSYISGVFCTNGLLS